MKVVLSTSPHVRHPAVLQEDFSPAPHLMYTFAPLGLLSLMACVRDSLPHVQCELYDVNRRIISGALPLDQRLYAAIARELIAGDPTVIGFMTECDSYHHIIQITAAIKEMSASTRIVLGGPHASAVATKTMQRHLAIDAVVVGEGETSFPDLLAAMGRGSEEPIPGTLRRVGAALVDGGVRPLVADLDSLPIPRYDAYEPSEGEEVFLEVGRGCPFQCAFCSTAPYWRRRHRTKSPARILQEVAVVRELYGATRVHFTHDLFTTRRDWVESVCNALVAAGTPVQWTCSARADTVDAPLLRLMRKAGCSAIYFGVESGSPRILREIHKDIPEAQTVAAVTACRSAGITPNAGVIVGFPTESHDSFRDTMSMYERLLRLGARPAHVFAYCPFAESALYPTLGALRTNGHFIDLPLGEATDRANRAIVAADRELYGSYFRPPLTGIVPDDERALDGIDEFSPLVEAALAPSLALADEVGMYEVYRRWARWVCATRASTDQRDYVRRYGTPEQFAAFLLEELSVCAADRGDILDGARGVLEHLRAIQAVRGPQAITMATHRSVSLARTDAGLPLALATQLTLGTVVRFAAFRHDVTPWLGGVSGALQSRRTYLVWQLVDGGTLRLVQTNAMVHSALRRLSRASTVCAADVVRDSLVNATSECPHVDAVMQSILTAAEEGILQLGPTC